MKERNVKHVILREGYCQEGESKCQEGKGGWIWLMCFLYMFEYGTLKPFGIVSREVAEEGD
jgi:hypothetical protein